MRVVKKKLRELDRIEAETFTIRRVGMEHRMDRVKSFIVSFINDFQWHVTESRMLKINFQRNRARYTYAHSTFKYKTNRKFNSSKTTR